MITFARTFPNLSLPAAFAFAIIALRGVTAQEVVATRVAAAPARIEMGKETIFGSRPHRFDWVLSSDKAAKGEVRLSIYRILDTTAVPVENGKVVANEMEISAGNPAIVSHEFTPPESERITSYLVTLTFRQGKTSRKVSSELLTVIPPDLLGQIKGMRILLIGFKEEDDEVRRFLESSGWNVSVHEETPESIDVDWAVHAPDSPLPPASQKTVIYRDFYETVGKPASVLTLIGKNPTGEEIRWEVPLLAWTSLPSSAKQQLLLMRITQMLSISP